MDPRTESRVLGLISVALTLFGVFAPYQWREMPSIITTSALGLAAAFALWAIWLVLPARFKKREGKVGVWGPWILIVGGPVLGLLWLYFGTQPESGKHTPSPQDRWTWSDLTAIETEALFAKLRDKGQHSVHVACNRAECAGLANSFDQLFKRLGWPSFVGEGGLLATGVTGILINPSDEAARLLKEAIETNTVLRVDLGPQRQSGDLNPIMLVIGTKPASMPSGPLAPALKDEQPDVALRFVYPTSPALVLVNQSGATARNIKWSVALWNMDDPRVYVNNPNAAPDAHDPLPIPIATFDFLRPRTVGGPQNLFGSPLVAPHIKNGQRLFGSASVICPECARGHTYIVSIIWGQGGWYAEVLNTKEGELLIPANFKKETIVSYYNEFLVQTSESARIPIQNK